LARYDDVVLRCVFAFMTKFPGIRPRLPLIAALCSSAILMATSAARAQSGANILVITNAADADSMRVGDYYASHRGVPATQVLALQRLPVKPPDAIERAAYEATIQQPIAAWLSANDAQDRIHYIVLTKGIPLRIAGSSGRNGTVASVDSELSALYLRLSGVAVQAAGAVANPYFLDERPVAEAQPFSHERVPLYLVTRLDGYSVDDVLKLVDHGMSPATEGRVVLDQRASWLALGNAWLKAAADRLRDAGLGDRVLLEATGKVVTNEPSVIGYYSWGSNDPAITERNLGLGFVPGAIAAMFVSYDGRTFHEPPSSWRLGSWEKRETYFEGAPQSLAGDLIRAGVTGVAAHVTEPFLDATIRPQVLFPAYFRGMNLAESFYMAMPNVSWETIVVGDPLCAPFRKEVLPSTSLDPGMDPETGLPRWFSARSVESFAGRGLNPAGVKAFLKAQALLAHQDRAGAEGALKAAVEAEGGLVTARILLGDMLMARQDYEGADAQYLGILKVEPNNLIALNNLAFNLAEHLGRPQDALPYAQRAFTVGGRAVAVADTLGWVYHLLGDNDQAIALLGPAASTRGAGADVLLHAARAFQAAGRPEPARAYLDRALQVQPSLESRSDVQALKAALK
jgi:uncharacterized protein (TIGR03790 family)